VNWLGFGLAFVCTGLYGIYMVPRKLTKVGDLYFLLSMCLGVALCTWVCYGVTRRLGFSPPPPDAALAGLACGPAWTLGLLFYVLSVSEMGLALATPIKNTTAVLGTVVGIAAFQEWRHTAPVPAIAGSVFIVLCACALGRTGENARDRSQATIRGVAYAILSALSFSLYTIPLKVALARGADNFALLAYMALGSLATAAVIFLVLQRDRRQWFRLPLRDHACAALAGLIWVLATLSLYAAIRLIGLAVTWSISNLNTVVSVLVGILVFHEINARKFRTTIWLGLLFAFVGVLLLGLSKWHPPG